MKKRKLSLDELQKSLSNQKGIIGIDSTGKSKQYWCGLAVIGGDEGSGGSGGSGAVTTGSQMTENPDADDYSDCPSGGY